MTAVLTPNAKQQFFDNAGRPLVGGRLFTYAAGTTTKIPSYVNSAGITQNSNPIILDFRGECNLWIPPNVAYKYLLAPPGNDDPPTNPIWTVDLLVSSQLITLYGGVDTGSANAYVINFVSNFTSYTDGIIIYFIPSNNNSIAPGASTINVNGLGVVPIVNQDGSPLYRNEIHAGEVTGIMFKGTGFVLLTTVGTAAFAAQRITTVQSMPASTITTCIFQSEQIDQGNNFDPVTGIFTAPRFGVYAFESTMTLVPGGTNCVLNGIYFSKNNTDVAGPARFDIGYGLKGALYSNTSNSLVFAGGVIMVLNALDTVQMRWDAGTSGAATNGLGIGSTFSGAQVA